MPLPPPVSRIAERAGRVLRGGLLLACLAASACRAESILESRPVAPAQAAPVAGISYYLPKKLVEVTVWGFAVPSKEGAEPAWRFFATYDGERVVPDHRHQFVIVPRWSAAAHDMVQVQMTAEGLLTAVHGRAKDETGEIVHELAKLASLLIRGPAPLPGTTRALPAEAPRTPRMLARYMFDPVDPASLEEVRGRLAPYGIGISLTKQSDCPTATSGAGCATTCECTSPGIYYRLPIPYRLRLEPAGLWRAPGVLGAAAGGEWELLDGGLEETLLMPNEAVCLYVPVDRRHFVTSETSMTFDQGMLRSVTTDKPSELLGFVRIPVDVASQILAVPSELLTIRIQEKTQEARLHEREAQGRDRQSELLDAERELLEAMRKYQRAKAGNGGGNGN